MRTLYNNPYRKKDYTWLFVSVDAPIFLLAWYYHSILIPIFDLWEVKKIYIKRSFFLRWKQDILYVIFEFFQPFLVDFLNMQEYEC